MSLLDEARKPQERKEADVVFGTKEDVAKETGYEAVCTGIYRKESDWTEGVFNVYVTGTMDDGRTLLVLGQTKVLREEIEASGLEIGKRFAVLHQGYSEKVVKGRKPARLDRFVVEGGAPASTPAAAPSKPRGFTAEEADASSEVPF
jgi:hypothetical protein